MYPATSPSKRRAINGIARITANVLHEAGYRCCLFGSAACSIYGMRNRDPRDVDMVVFTSHDPEDIKRVIVEADGRFFTTPSRKPGETYRVLWFRLPRPSGFQGRRTCKVDILITGTLDLPNVPKSKVVYTRVRGVPCVPMIVLLGMKLRGWVDHRKHPEPYYSDKQYDDIKDIAELLHIAVTAGEHVSDYSWLRRKFRQDMEVRIESFCRDAREDTEHLWRELGFDGDW
ncbi:hypothetical protein CONPUDRAFT_140525 [Coniophora puteana RWD-64-598 SS2]|uniref:Nucleotidyltransferase n=1 Tax=Coniophora puteana (strain RWD-64-598) TaxID=741705 RepID=R7SF82_CONPW|nr:uncharacterized protein CONPUDRAFT_140525 [Coniophora puteana RWD-64-598 SS2]EIW74407.1 hypothetical protein CONPUDRAFT_140525 [Coniophora puteana RWD-64-598 SS2]